MVMNFVDLPIDSMVDLSIVFCMTRGKLCMATGDVQDMVGT
jgi:hypothetical protein